MSTDRTVAEAAAKAAAAGGAGGLAFIARHAERASFSRTTGKWDYATTQALVETAAEGNRAWFDDPLTEGGLEQAAVLANVLAGRVDRIVTSPFLRTAQTSLVVAKQLGINTVEVDPSLAEDLRYEWFRNVDLTEFNLLRTAAELNACPLLDTDVTFVDKAEPASAATMWEDDTALTQRAERTAAALLADPEAPGTLLVTHGGTCHRLGAALNDAPEPYDGIHTGYTSFAVVTLSENKNKAQEEDAMWSVDAVSGFETPLEFTPDQDWFVHVSRHWPALTSSVRAKGKSEPVHILEIGSWEGCSATWWLTHLCAGHPDSTLTLVDHFDGNALGSAGAARKARLEGNIRRTNLTATNKTTMLPYFSFTALTHHLIPADKRFDFIYIDGSHLAVDTLMDALLAWQLLQSGGVLLFDDYDWPVYDPVKYPCNPPSKQSPDHPKRGIDAFLDILSHELEIIHKDYQVAVRKAPNAIHRPYALYPGVDGRGPVDIALCTDASADNLRMLAVALHSMITHASDAERRLRVWIFAFGEIAPETLARLEGLFASRAQQLRIVQVDENIIRSLLPEAEQSRGAVWGKCFLPVLLPTDVRVVLYLDCDILVRGDVTALWDFRKHAELLAVGDFFHPSGPDVLELDAPYFNAGVLLWDVAATRTRHPTHESCTFTATVAELAHTALPRLLFKDQCALNVLFRHGWMPLPPTWNVQGLGVYVRRAEPFKSLSYRQTNAIYTEPELVHFCGDAKPHTEKGKLTIPAVFLEEWAKALKASGWE